MTSGAARVLVFHPAFEKSRGSGHGTRPYLLESATKRLEVETAFATYLATFEEVLERPEPPANLRVEQASQDRFEQWSQEAGARTKRVDVRRQQASFTERAVFDGRGEMADSGGVFVNLTAAARAGSKLTYSVSMARKALRQVPTQSERTPTPAARAPESSTARLSMRSHGPHLQHSRRLSPRAR